MINTTLLQVLVDQLKELTDETKTINNKIDGLIVQVDLIGDKLSMNELECLGDQSDRTDPPALGDSCALPLKMVVGLIDHHSSTNFFEECTPVSVATLLPTDTVLVCFASAPATQHNAAIDCKRNDMVIIFTWLRRFAQHAALCPSAFNTGYKQWKPGLRSA